MNEKDAKRVLEISKVMRDDMRALMDRYHEEISRLNNGDDPHIPVIEWLQLNLLQAACEFLVSSGCKPSDALKLTLDHTGISAKNWFDSVTQIRGSKYALNKRG